MIVAIAGVSVLVFDLIIFVVVGIDVAVVIGVFDVISESV